MLATIFVSTSFLFGILVFLVTNGYTNAFDESVLLWINQHASPAYDSFFLAVTKLGNPLFVTVASLALALGFLWRKRYPKAALVAIGMGGSTLLGVMFKAMVERTRPDLWEWLITETSYSFPSGHATASMSLAFIIVLLVWRTKWRFAAILGGILYVLLIAVSRLYLGVHYPTDILGGWLLGLAWVSLVALGCLYVVRQKQAR